MTVFPRETLAGASAGASPPEQVPAVIGEPRREAGCPLPADESSVRSERAPLIERWHLGAYPLAPLADAFAYVGVAAAWALPPTDVAVLTTASLAGTALAHGYGDRSTLAAGGGWYVRPSAAGALLAAGAALLMQRPVGVAAAAGAWLCLVVVRTLLWLAVASWRRRHLVLRPAVVVGQPDAAQQVANRLAAFTDHGLSVTAFHDATDVNDLQRACRLLASGLVRDVVVTDGVPQSALVELLHAARRTRVHFTAALPSSAVAGVGLTGRVGDLPLLALGRTAPSAVEVAVKRTVDVVGGILLLLVTGPLIVVAALAVRCHDRGPAVYRQQRVGRDGRQFTILKLRTMVLEADRVDVTTFGQPPTDGLLFKLPQDPRVTSVGAVLRRFAIDELPQLWNVVRGEMSLVGPRPLAVEPHAFDRLAARRHAVRPGITGPWQVSGGNALPCADMIDLDVAYAATWSLRRDVRVLLRTIATVAIRRSPY